MLMAIDYFLTFFHIGITLFNTLGWAFSKTRKAHLICMAITLVSWLGFGLIHGIGYCFLTDWHYQILEKRGYTELPYSFITFVIDRFFNIQANDELVIQWTLYGMIAIVILTALSHLNDFFFKTKS